MTFLGAGSLHFEMQSLRTNGTPMQNLGSRMFHCIRSIQVREVLVLAAFTDAVRMLLGWMFKRPKIAATPRTDAAEGSAWIEG